ncbi:hypothetical protein BDP27DRAFT_1420318 [Rhodocollybia butyracea]|uniref:DUF7727 domain-containing protein n=1 Tax=Rhodocollybia butyracea TaxID=206335 RepID=A0A9P5U8P5_9AGAR|nr:hypothetical protein BDP27DRAFT_1420318 [Rhodocollybia butyracea]
MGNLVWHELARLVSITASICEYCFSTSIVASNTVAIRCSVGRFLGALFPQVLLDFVGGIVRNPGGIQPAPGVAVFITLIVKAPIIQILVMILGLTMIALEFSLPQVKGLAIYRSFVVRIVLLFFQAFLCILFYQGTNACLYSLIALGCYTRAQMLGEKMEVAKENRGKGGRA